MKTKQLLFMAAVFAVTCFAQETYAKIWRVNNNATGTYGENFGGNINYPVFKELPNAYSSALVNSGDTIHMEGSASDYVTATFPYITKKLIIIGAGYFLNENPDASNDKLETRIDGIDFAAGSDSSQLIGVHIIGSHGIRILSVSNITVKRCLLDYSITVSSSVSIPFSDINIVQNFFNNSNPNYINASAVDVGSSFPTNFVFDNNICQRTLLLSSGSKIYTAYECKNNIFDCPAISGKPSIQMNVGTFQNNVLKTAAATVVINDTTNLNVSYNISSSSTGQFGSANNNLVVPAINSLFITSSSTDGAYQIADGSQADNTGSDGTDRGAFGGAAVISRYMLSGLAAIPVVYQITTAGVTTSNLQVNIQARTIK